MSIQINNLPVDLKAIAQQIDNMPEVGNQNQSIGTEEIAEYIQVRELSSDITVEERMQLERLEQLIRAEPNPTTSTTGITRTTGPDGTFTSTVYPPENGFQREVIEFTNEDNPRGLLVGREGTEINRFLEGDGVVGANVTCSGAGLMHSQPSVTVGGNNISSFTGAQVAGRQPFHGPLEISSNSSTHVTSLEVFHRVPSASETTDFFPINKTVCAGETYEIDLSQHRAGMGLDQIECIWTANYSVPDPSGRRSDEGKPFWMDGVYADVFLVDKDGNEKQVKRTKFVDANEVDNMHDLRGLEGEKLKIRFYAKNPEGENHPITLKGVRFRYEAETTPTPPASFNIGRVFAPGETAEIELPEELRDKKIGRVDVRWTDMLSGTWTEPGYAHGRLVIDGRNIGSSESVQSPETQSFSYLNGIKAEDGKVGIKIERDEARIEWIKVYFDD